MPLTRLCHMPFLFVAALPCVIEAQANWTKRTLTTTPSARLEHVAVYDIFKQRVVLFGGRGGAYLNDTWEWDGTKWLLRQPTLKPSARSNHAMAYDLFRARVVMFSGSNGSADTWLWDGTNWELRTTTTQPSPRQIHSMAFDTGRGRTVLFGGNASGVLQNDTWEWDGTRWTSVMTSIRPPVRWGHQLAYDPIRRQTMLFGGNGSRSTRAFLNDTWLWNGTKWTRMTPTVSPPPSTDSTLVWDTLRERMVLFGGSGTNKILNETWEWDGTNWTKRSPATPPPARCCHVAAYDEARRETVMFGGYPTNDSSTYVYQTSTPALFSTSGTSCAGSGGTPTLTANSLPWINSTFKLTLGSIGSGASSLLISGLSNTTWTGGNLPFNLGVIGYANCDLQVSMDLLLGGLTSVSIPIPNSPILTGSKVYFQAASLGTGNQLGVSTASTATIGAR